jgi:hypothetical protein
MTITDILISLGILAMVLISDLGTRKLTGRRLRRPVIIAAAVVAFFLPTIPTTGGDLTWEIAAATLGACLGLLSLVTIRVGTDADGNVVTTAGVLYAAVWIVSIGGRLLLGYSMSNVFPHATYSFMVGQHLTGGPAIRAMFICMILGEVAVRTATIATRYARLHGSAPAVSAPAQGVAA